MILTIPGKAAKAAAAMCSKEASRPTLNDAAIRAGHLIACNGHVAVRLPLHDRPEDAGHPHVNPVPEHPDWRVPASALKGLKASQCLAVNVVTGAALVLQGADMVAVLPNLETDATFPNLDAVMPRTDPVARVILAPDYMIAVARLAQALGWDGVTLDLTDGALEPGETGTTASRAVVYRGEDRDAAPLGLVMPRVLK